MKNLFLVDGASGVGKSDLLHWVQENSDDRVGLVVKGTTRAPRLFERDDEEIRLDLEFLTQEEFNQRQYDYTYWYGKAQYGFFRSELTNKLLERDNVFVIVRSTQLINRLVAEYSFINAIPMFIYTDRAELSKRLRRRQLDPIGIRERIDRSDIAMRDYYAHPELYREVVVNNSALNQFHNTIDRVVGKYSSATPSYPHVLAVMMSFNKSNPKLFDYFDAMQAAATAVSPKLTCARVDDEPGSPSIPEQMQKLIDSARCIIVDLTENKQSVYYELGFALAKRKTCIITAEQGTKPHFYTRPQKILFYDSARDLREKLIRELSGVLAVFPGVTGP